MLCASYFNRSFHISFHFNYTMLTSFMGAFPMAWQVKNPPVMQETHEMRVRSLGQEDPLKQEMATHFTISAWKIPRTEKPGKLQSKGSQRVGHDWAHTPKLCERVPVHIMCLNSVVFPLGWLIKICIPFCFIFIFLFNIWINKDNSLCVEFCLTAGCFRFWSPEIHLV